VTSSRPDPGITTVSPRYHRAWSGYHLGFDREVEAWTARHRLGAMIGVIGWRYSRCSLIVMLGWDLGGTDGGVSNRSAPHANYLLDHTGGLASAFERPGPAHHLDASGGGGHHPYHHMQAPMLVKAEGSALDLNGNGSMVSRSGGSLDLNAFGWERHN
jgi:hypothetical protein